jgi:hypothetical protein
MASVMTSKAGTVVPVVAQASARAPRAFTGFKPSKAALMGKTADTSLAKAVAARVAVQVSHDVDAK